MSAGQLCFGVLTHLENLKSLNNLRSNLKVTSIKTAVHEENMIIILNYRDKQNSESVSSLITVWSDTLQLISDFENDLVITDFIFQENDLYCLCHNKLKIFKLQNSKPKLNQVVDLDNLGTGLETSIGTKLMHWVAFSDWLMGFELESAT